MTTVDDIRNAATPMQMDVLMKNKKAEWQQNMPAEGDLVAQAARQDEVKAVGEAMSARQAEWEIKP